MDGWISNEPVLLLNACSTPSTVHSARLEKRIVHVIILGLIFPYRETHKMQDEKRLIPKLSGLLSGRFANLVN
jgi:hypothetical protein